MRPISPRTSILLGAAAWWLSFLTTACAMEEALPDDGDEQPRADPEEPPPPPAPGFQVVTPTVELQPGEEKTYCYFFPSTRPALCINSSVGPL